MVTNRRVKNANIFSCEKCNFTCSKQSNYTKHLLTAKHIKVTNVTELAEKNATPFMCCICNKEYSSRMGLWRHNKKCQKIDNEDMSHHIENNITDSNLITKLLMQNQELLTSNQQFKEFIIEQQHENQHLQKQLINAVNCGNTYHTTTTNNNNQKFNLNFFLNTTCKDAMNMSDFIENIEIGFKDIENIGKNGYVSGMTDMILSRIKELDVTKRPLHCTDLKRETMYIKDNDEWCKDTPNNSKLHRMIDCVAKQNYATIPLWRQQNPECHDSNNPKYDFCVHMMRNILGDVGLEQTRLDNKIIKNLSKHILVNKEV
jgi:hypothetical protein|uniref:C2H2-type domain-containing protein n=1 Tax=viral metagenome TaxID=1070528 RepID=A0A6C0IQH0_9ZZZZ